MICRLAYGNVDSTRVTGSVYKQNNGLKERSPVAILLGVTYRGKRLPSGQPVLEKLDPVYEEAAGVMGAGRSRIFRKIILPEILPSVLTGFGLAFGRCLGEYGSVVFIAGNKPFETEITPLIIMSELQEYDYKSATAIALVMLAASFLILFLVNMVQHRNAKILKGGR